MTIESINGKAVPSPISFGWQQQDINTNDSGRVLSDALMNKETIAKKHTVPTQWSKLTTEEISGLLHTILDSGEYCEIRYLDPYEGKLVTKTFYSGDRNANMTNDLGNIEFWELTVNFVLR